MSNDDFALDPDMGGEKRIGPVDRRIARLADGQHGVVARRQLTRLGLGTRAIDHRVECGRLHVVHRGVYAVGRRKLTREGVWMAAVLAGGPGAVLSHRSAAELWRLLPHTDRIPDITVARPRTRRGAAVAWHSSSLPEDEIATRESIRVTTVARTLLDLGAVVSPDVLERAMREAEFRRYADSPSLAALLERHANRRGRARIRAILTDGAIGLGRTRSELEERFLTFLDRHGLPRPRLNVPISLGAHSIEADCAWVDSRVIVELDGRETHETPTAFESDRGRDRVLAVAGWRVIRVTWRQLHLEPQSLAADLHALLSVPHGERLRF